MGAVDILKVSLEFSPKLGVRELPELSGAKESNIPGLFIVGDLADAPIIKVALNQGYDVAHHVIKELGGEVGADEDVLDVAVIGAGPAGIGAALALKETGARYVVFEKERPFNTIQNFPKAKFVFSEPRFIENKGSFWFDDAHKEDLIDRWADEVESRGLILHQPEEVIDVQKEGDVFTIKTRVGDGGLMGDYQTLIEHGGEAGQENTYKARRVVLAIGRRGSVNKLGVPGEDMLKVAYALKDPDDHKGRRVMVIGGGDSAVEAAVATANAGADVTISYRRDSFSRAKKGNKDQIEALIDAGRVRAQYNTTPVEIKEASVVLKRGAETLEVPNDDVFIFAGTKLPKPFLERIGVTFEGQMTLKRFTWITSFALLTYLFYVLKHKKSYFPFGPEDPLGFVPGALKVDLGFRMVDASFWGTLTYAIFILIFGVMAYRKYPMVSQKRRYISLIVFQWVFLFGIPEVIAPAVHYIDLLATGGAELSLPWLGGWNSSAEGPVSVGYKFYALSVPWPLSIWSVIDGPNWTPSGSVAGLTWMGLGAFSAFVLMPLYVRYNGERFCSYMCGCGGLAETLGDQWRHLAPRGKTAKQAEWFGVAILIMAVPVTLLIINDAWALVQPESLRDAKTFAQNWYVLVVDFWLASVLGVAFYPYLGNRVWCRFFCPLRAWMETLARWFSKIAIDANDKCIGCGECTRYCQMGIPVQQFAQKQQQFHNGNSACIQCGICIQVCPMEVLSIGTRGVKLDLGGAGPKVDAPAASGVWGLKIDNEEGVELRHG